MIRITAKKLLMGKVFGTFFVLFTSYIISLIGVSLTAAASVALGNETVKNVFENAFGNYSVPFRVAFCVFMIFLGLLLFGLGRNLRIKRLCRTVSDDRFEMSFKKSVWFTVCFCIKLLFMLCWGFIYFLPFALCLSFLIMSLSQGPMEENVLLCWSAGCAVLLILGLVFLFITAQRYSLWEYYLCREDGEVISSLYKSIDKTNERCVKAAFFKLTMLGWILSCLLVVPAVFVVPYYGVSTLLFSLDARENEDEKKREEIPPAVFRIIKDL